MRYIDDLLTLNNPSFQAAIADIYPHEVQLKKTTECETKLSYLDILVTIENATLLYDKRGSGSSVRVSMIGGAKRIRGCSSRTCNEAVRGDMGLDSLQGRRDKAKLKWWYKVATMLEHRYSRKLFVQEWNVKPRRGRQRKYWCKVVDNLFSSLGLDKAEWLEDIQKGSCSLRASWV